MSHPRRRLGALVTLALVSTSLVAAGCSAPGSSDNSPATNTGQPKASVATNPAKGGKVTLNVWDQEVRGGQNAEMTQLNKEFQEKYPNVTINRTSKSFSDLKTTLRLALSGKNPPDVVEANQGYPDMVTFVKAGQLVPLDKYAKLYGWEQRYPKTLLDLNRVSDDFQHFGEGKLYGISQMGEYITVYYNKSKLKSLGLTPPKTWSDFAAQLPKIKAKGQTPIEFGNLDKWPAIHTFGVIQAQTAGKQDVRNLVFGTGNAKWTDSATVKAAKILQDWAQKGYFTKGANGLGYDDASKKFADGTGVYLITGTWQAAVLKKPMGKNLGLMLPPPAQAGGEPTTTGGESLAFAVTSKSQHPDVAAAYLDFITNAHADDVMTQTGNLPAVPGKAADALPADSPEGQMVAGWKDLSKVDGLVPYLDYSTPTFYDTITASLQSLIGGQTTPEQFTQTLQADYQKFHQK
ncbi:extracellular solute-binding protein [Segeticoccus rhizosphaerae]|jgi:raffinose/stachyose/melibiose transport system substrate-binding protein|uniref:extracellular solute-binding protein n=1 Tax=Segeticoccus rhizosphaerae TaxID=1104777 RepID=UPI0010BF9BB3|nr:extracellular solute-binding protein [Ornithinicoccus soli]